VHFILKRLSYEFQSNPSAYSKTRNKLINSRFIPYNLASKDVRLLVQNKTKIKANQTELRLQREVDHENIQPYFGFLLQKVRKRLFSSNI
jgi:hypothetical protein